MQFMVVRGTDAYLLVELLNYYDGVQHKPLSKKQEDPLDKKFKPMSRATHQGKTYTYLLHLTTDLGRWVLDADLRTMSKAEAYQDADPRFWPENADPRPPY